MPSLSKFPVNRVKILNGAVWTKCPVIFFCWSKIRPVPCELNLTACRFTWRWGTTDRWGNMRRVTPPIYHLNVIKLRACLQGGWVPHVGEVTRLRGLPACPYYLLFSFDDIYMIGGMTTWQIIWTGGLPHLSVLPHLPGVPHLHVNRP